MRQDLIDITHEMEQILIKLGQTFRANAYKKAATSLEKMDTEITTPSDLDAGPNIGWDKGELTGMQTEKFSI